MVVALASLQDADRFIYATRGFRFAPTPGYHLLPLRGSRTLNLLIPLALCPRIKLRLTDSPLPDNIRLAGEGTLDQVRSDLEDLAYLGAEYVLLDTYTGQPEVAQENDQAMYSLLADKVLRLS
jgi:hypothetical protein